MLNFVHLLKVVAIPDEVLLKCKQSIVLTQEETKKVEQLLVSTSFPEVEKFLTSFKPKPGFKVRVVHKKGHCSECFGEKIFCSHLYNGLKAETTVFSVDMFLSHIH